MNPVLKLLMETGGQLGIPEMARVLGLTEDQVKAEIEELKRQGILLGWRPVFNFSRGEDGMVRAVIEVRITPERGGGFDRLAERIAKFDEVESCYLMSGGYDLLVFVSGESLHKVAAFVSEKLATIEGVLSTSTHFLLRTYKEQGFLVSPQGEAKTRLDVSP